MAGEAIHFSEDERRAGFTLRLQRGGELEELRQREYQRVLAEAEAERVRRIEENEAKKAVSAETDVAIGGTALRESID